MFQISLLYIRRTVNRKQRSFCWQFAARCSLSFSAPCACRHNANFTALHLISYIFLLPVLPVHKQMRKGLCGCEFLSIALLWYSLSVVFYFYAVKTLLLARSWSRKTGCLQRRVARNGWVSNSLIFHPFVWHT